MLHSDCETNIVFFVVMKIMNMRDTKYSKLCRNENRHAHLNTTVWK